MQQPTELTYVSEKVIYQFQAFGELVLRSDMMEKLGFKTSRQWRAQVALWEKRKEEKLLEMIEAHRRKQYIPRKLVRMVVESIEGAGVAVLFS